MRSVMKLVVACLFLLAGTSTQAFYDDAVETHSVVTNVMSFGALADGVANDTDAVQAAIDYVTAQEGGGDVVIPAGTYVLKGLELKSNVHLRIDSTAILNLDGGVSGTDGGTMINASGSDDWVENISIQGVGGRFNVIFPPNATKTRFVQLKKVRNFLLSDFTVYGNLSSYSSVVFGPSSFDEETRGMPTQGTMRNASIYNSEYGYGLIQAQACDTVLFTNLFASGGVALRFETGWDKMGELQYGGVFNVVGRNLSAYGAKQVVMMAPVALQQGPVDIEGVYGTNCNGVVTVADGGLRSLENPDIIPGSYAKGSSIRNVTAVFGTTAQYKAMPDDIPPEYVNLFSNVAHNMYGAPVIGPSLTVVQNNSENVTVSNVKSYGFTYTPPIKGDGYRQTEEPFTSTNYASNISGDFWDVTSRFNADGTNWISGNGSVGQMDLMKAIGENHALNYWGFKLEPDEDITIASDFRYAHQSGGDMLTALNGAAFGLMFSTDPSAAVGENRYCLLGNKGPGLGLIDDELSLLTHVDLNLDTVAGGWSDTFRLKWMIQRGETSYQGTALLYDHDDTLIYTGPTADLGIPNGTKIWAGYSTGTHGIGGAASGLSRVELDNFVFEASYVNEAPIWLQRPARAYAPVSTPYEFNLRGLVHEPNGKRVKYYMLQGPEWLRLDESGNLTGTPSVFDIGANECVVSAEDYEGLFSTNRLVMTVSSASSGSFRLSPVADAGVFLYATDDGNNATNNYGASRTFVLQRSDAATSNKVREVYFKYDLADIPGDLVTNAVLRLKASATDDSMVQTLWSVSDDDWSEGSITYANRPAVVAPLISAAIPDLDHWVEFNITDQVQQEWAGDHTLSLGLTALGGFQASYHSRDDTPGWRPELVVQTARASSESSFIIDSVVVGDPVIVGESHGDNLIQLVQGDDTWSFRSLGGPSWLAIAENGQLTGTPSEEYVGVNRWGMQVADGLNSPVMAVLEITVLNDADWAAHVFEHGLSGNPAADFDEDGQSDLLEYAFGGQCTNGAIQAPPAHLTFYPDGTIGYSCLQLNRPPSGMSYAAKWADHLTEATSWTNSWNRTTISPSDDSDYDLVERQLYEFDSDQRMFKVEITLP